MSEMQTRKERGLCKENEREREVRTEFHASGKMKSKTWERLDLGHWFSLSIYFRFIEFKKM